MGKRKGSDDAALDQLDAELKVEYAPNLSKADKKRLRKQRKQEKLLKKLKKDDEADEVEASSGDSKNKNSKKKKNDSVEMSGTGAGETDKESVDAVDRLEVVESKIKPKGRKFTVSIAVAGSVLDNAQSPALRSYLAGQIARAAAIFNVDEIIIFDDTGGEATAACEQMARILQFLECPQYLRKFLFPIHQDLKFSGVISPLDIPHHLRRDEVLPYREGIVAKKPHKEGKGSYVYVGLEKDVLVDKVLPETTRVTVKLDEPELLLSLKGKLRGKLVSPYLPKAEAGIYWGYTVRIANSLSQIFSECPFKEGGYDVIIGTSEKGTPVSDLKLNSFKRMLIVFGGVEGLEYAFENDESTTVENVSNLFQHYVNTCPSQGSRTIRTEEAILISLAAFSPLISSCQE